MEISNCLKGFEILTRLTIKKYSSTHEGLKSAAKLWVV